MLVALYRPEELSAKDWMTETADRYGLTLYEPSGEWVSARYTAEGQPELTLARPSPALAAAICQLQPGTGVVLGSLSGLVNGTESAAVTLQYLSGDGLPEIAQQQFSQTLAIVSPDPASKVYTDTIFLMGTSDPNQPLTVNGQNVERYGSYGMWGLEVSLAEGDNVFTAQQGESSGFHHPDQARTHQWVRRPRCTGDHLRWLGGSTARPAAAGDLRAGQRPSRLSGYQHHRHDRL